MSAPAFRSNDYNFRPTALTAAFSTAGIDKGGQHVREPKKASLSLIRKDGKVFPHLRVIAG